ncbi:MAG: hypothetical protein ABEI86_04485 [Halobacteriaceae archaeon]
MTSLSRRTALRALGTLTCIGSIPKLGSADSGETNDEKRVWRTVIEGYDGQAGNARIRTDPDTLAALNMRAGDVVAVGRTRGGEGVPARIWRSDRAEWGERKVRVGRFIRQATGVPPGEDVQLQPVDPYPAERVVLTKPPREVRLVDEPVEEDILAAMIYSAAFGRPVIKGTILPLPVSGSKNDFLEPYIMETEPEGHVRVGQKTDVVFR